LRSRSLDRLKVETASQRQLEHLHAAEVVERERVAVVVAEESEGAPLVQLLGRLTRSVGQVLQR
jgi:hypothetical protein